MKNNIKIKKDELRKYIKEKLMEFKGEDQSLLLCNKLKQTVLWKNARHIMLFYPLKWEINVLTLFQRNTEKTFYFPKVFNKNLKIYKVENLDNFTRSKFGIYEPNEKLGGEKSPEVLDLIIVPGIAFTNDGKRLGQGGGYYDRFLDKISKLEKNINTISLAFSSQILEEIPMGEYDKKVDDVIYL